MTLPRLAFADFSYVGGFRLPDFPSGGDSFSYGGTVMAYNPARNSLFINSLRNNVAEVTIPTVVNANDVTRLPFASYLQPFVDPTEGHLYELATGEAFLAGFVVQGDRLYATGSVYYDALNTQRVSHFSHSTNLAEPSFVGMSQVWETGKTGYVAGYLANIPGEWQSSLGGSALTGQCCVPIVSRTSFGPAAFAFNPPSIGRQTAIPATPLLYYTQTHATLGPWDGSNNERYNGTAKMGGAAVIAGTRTALFIGRIGLGTFCYGHGVSDPALVGQIAADGEINCYDPTNFHKGQHAYPYRYQMWAYDLGDFAAVKAGSKQPWEVEPYAVWPFELPTAMPPQTDIRIGGIAYDAQRQLLYISQYQADKDGYGYRPIVHAVRINASGSGAPPPAPQPTTVTLTPDVAAPQPPGASIRWSAAATGGQAPYEYKWAAHANGAWSVLRDWSASQTFDWQPTVAASDARMSVWVRTAPSGLPSGDITADAIAATAEYPFPIADSGTENSAAVSGVTLTSNLAAPQPVSSSIVWTAMPSGGSGALVYQWFISQDGGASWTQTGSYSPSNQLTWTPTVANNNYRVAVWVKRAANTTADFEAEAKTAAFAITDASTARVSSVALTSNLAAPQPLGSSIVWTATPAGGAGNLLYLWFISEDGGASWNQTGPYASSNQLTWTPTAVNANYRIAVWVTRAGNTTGDPEAEAKTAAFAITEPDRRVASVTLAANLASPQPLSSTVVWTATQSGATGPVVYKWFISNDGGGSWTDMGPYSSSNQLAWTPTAANANYRIAVWATRAGNTSGDAEAEAKSAAFAITDRPVASVTLAANLASPQPLSSTVVWTATQSGATGPVVYKWFISNDGGASWTDLGPYASSNQLTWTPTAANPNYRIAVWATRAGNTNGDPEAEAKTGTFAIVDRPVASVTLTSNVPSPQPLSSTIVWTATQAGGTGAIVYKWLVSNDGGASWTAAGPWTASNQLGWTPAAAGANYRVAVWAKRASNAVDAAEAAAESAFAIVSLGVASVTLTSTLESPQPVFSTIVWTATPIGGTGTLVYRWHVSEDGGVSWSATGAWRTSNRLTWQPNKVNANYRVRVWVKQATNTSPSPEASAEAPFTVTARP